MASVKVVFADCVDYAQVAKFNGRWVIVNVLWQYKPEPDPKWSRWPDDFLPRDRFAPVSNGGS